jgi:hypothetical protein
LAGDAVADGCGDPPLVELCSYRQSYCVGAAKVCSMKKSRTSHHHERRKRVVANLERKESI